DQGRPTGRIWRGDRWLREHLPQQPPDLAAIGQRLARAGVTGVTDASVTTDESAASLLGTAHCSGALPQRLVLMSGGYLEAATDGGYEIGPVKILLDDHALPEFDAFA